MATGGPAPAFPQRKGRHPVVIAHRGASADAPENTMAAFAAAWAAGAQWVETDVQPTTDNVPVLLHDDDLDRTSDGHGPVRAARWAHVQKLDAGSWFPAGGFAGEPVPSLANLLAALPPATSVLLEIKGEHTVAQLDAELGAIAVAGVDDRVVIQSFEVTALGELVKLQPGRPIALLVERLHDDPVAACAELGAVGYNPDHELLRDRPEIVAALHDAGVTVCVWTVDDPLDWAFLTELGVDGIITNRPGTLLAWQAQH